MNARSPCGSVAMWHEPQLVRKSPFPLLKRVSLNRRAPSSIRAACVEEEGISSAPKNNATVIAKNIVFASLIAELNHRLRR